MRTEKTSTNSLNSTTTLIESNSTYNGKQLKIAAGCVFGGSLAAATVIIGIAALILFAPAAAPVLTIMGTVGVFSLAACGGAIALVSSTVALALLKASKSKSPAQENTEVLTGINTHKVPPAIAINYSELSNLDQEFAYFRCFSYNILQRSSSIDFKGAPEKEYQDQFRELEKYVANKYQNAFYWQNGWHGNLSYQRIIFQDPEIIEKLSNPKLFECLCYLHYKQKGSEQTYSLIFNRLCNNSLTLAACVLYGINSSLLSYLITAKPNYKIRPSFMTNPENYGVLANDDRLEVENENPYSLTNEQLINIKKMINSFKTTFEKLFPNIDNGDENHAAKYSQYSTDQLVEAFNKIDKTRVKKFIEKRGHCDDIIYKEGSLLLESLDQFLERHPENPELILGYSCISHALDSIHFAALLLRDDRNLNRLLNTPGTINELMKIRLQQVLFNIEDFIKNECIT